ncbi:hypothetical protein KM043_015241 [Ampulex compressa]|nr:hypothetical protein KM043_015241 [Ampulex compressa]
MLLPTPAIHHPGSKTDIHISHQMDHISYLAQDSLFSGERLDVLLETNQPAGKYQLDVEGLQDCRDLRHEGLVTYDGTAQDSSPMERVDAPKPEDFTIGERGYDCTRIAGNAICALDLKGSSSENITEEQTEETIYIPYDVNSFTSISDDMTDNSFSIFDYVYYPAYLTLKREEMKIPQINGMSFKYPSSPILSQPENISDKVICSLEQTSVQCEETPLFCECVQILEVPQQKTVEIVLIDEGFGGNVSHTFHMHGYNASIVGRGNFDRPISKEEIVAFDRQNQLPRNLLDPPRKDTFVVPNKGYVILRFYTDNLGYWLWEARGTAISPGTFGPGMQFLMRIGSQEDLPPLPLEFPTCGGNKGPFMIFEKH